MSLSLSHLLQFTDSLQQLWTPEKEAEAVYILRTISSVHPRLAKNNTLLWTTAVVCAEKLSEQIRSVAAVYEVCRRFRAPAEEERLVLL